MFYQHQRTLSSLLAHVLSVQFLQLDLTINLWHPRNYIIHLHWSHTNSSKILEMIICQAAHNSQKHIRRQYCERATLTPVPSRCHLLSLGNHRQLSSIHTQVLILKRSNDMLFLVRLQVGPGRTSPMLQISCPQGNILMQLLRCQHMCELLGHLSPPKHPLISHLHL